MNTEESYIIEYLENIDEEVLRLLVLEELRIDRKNHLKELNFVKVCNYTKKTEDNLYKRYVEFLPTEKLISTFCDRFLHKYTYEEIIKKIDKCYKKHLTN